MKRKDQESGECPLSESARGKRVASGPSKIGVNEVPPPPGVLPKESAND